MSRQLVAVLPMLGLVLAIVVASAAGWLGLVVVCGADRSPGCITWPLPVSEGLWLAFLVGVAALLVWQART